MSQARPKDSDKAPAPKTARRASPLLTLVLLAAAILVARYVRTPARPDAAPAADSAAAEASPAPATPAPVADAAARPADSRSGGKAPEPAAAPGRKAPAAPAAQSGPVREPPSSPPAAAAAEPRPVPAGSYHAKGRVIKLLADDNDGIRHQKFLIRLPDRSTLLVVHNVDLAPRLDDLAVGDEVEVCGEFVENDRGGLVHWTHHAPPRSAHAAGWIRHMGRIYE